MMRYPETCRNRRARRWTPWAAAILAAVGCRSFGAYTPATPDFLRGRRFAARTATADFALSPLPQEIMNTLSRIFPGGKITGFERERELGVWLFEIRVRMGRNRYRAELTRDGELLEISQRIAPADIPPGVALVIRNRLRPRRLLGAERIESRGRIRSGVYKKLEKPRISYEVTYIGADGRRHEKQLTSSGVLELPAAAWNVLNTRFKGRRVTEVELDPGETIRDDCFDVTLVGADRTRVEVVVDRKGRILETEYPIAFKALPLPAQRVLLRDKGARTFKRIDVRRRDVLDTSRRPKNRGKRSRKAKGKKAQPKIITTYAVSIFSRRNRVREYRFDARGRLLSRSGWERAPKPEKEEDDGDRD